MSIITVCGETAEFLVRGRLQQGFVLSSYLSVLTRDDLTIKIQDKVVRCLSFTTDKVRIGGAQS